MGGVTRIASATPDRIQEIRARQDAQVMQVRQGGDALRTPGERFPDASGTSTGRRRARGTDGQ
ncbi:hypothetical protein GCM10020369_54260 [Cryptosporangium minutisporangium]|uniref:Uncharacterized protein n=1 Tax=Cryptosporangium minutisporangium TaxID=113569 RepID=A0ABP6T4N7_9ACTN